MGLHATPCPQRCYTQQPENKNKKRQKKKKRVLTNVGLLMRVNSRGRCYWTYTLNTQSEVFIVRHLVSYMSVWHVQTAALIHLELRASIPNTYSFIPPFTGYMGYFTQIFPYVYIIFPAPCVCYSSPLT